MGTGKTVTGTGLFIPLPNIPLPSESSFGVILCSLCSLLFLNAGRIRGEATETVAFSLQGENGIEKLTRYGFSEDEILALPPFAFIARNDLGARRLGHVTG